MDLASASAQSTSKAPAKSGAVPGAAYKNLAAGVAIPAAELASERRNISAYSSVFQPGRRLTQTKHDGDNASRLDIRLI